MARIYLIAGDASAEHYALYYLKNHPGPIEAIRGIGGDQLQAYGMDIAWHQSDLSVIGITGIIKRLPFFLKLLKDVSQDIQQWQPDLLLLIDFPGFNVRLLERLPDNLCIHYLAPPQLFAWGRKRIHTLAKHVNQVFHFYDFEKPFLQHAHLPCQQLRQPKVDAIGSLPCPQQKKRIALLPGSRSSELQRHLPILEPLRQQLEQAGMQAFYVIAQAKRQQQALHFGIPETLIHATPLARLEADIAIAASGTVTLELALRGIPMVIIYRTNWMNFLLARLLVDVQHIGLPNLIMAESVFPEFIQQACKVPALMQAIEDLSLQKQHSACLAIRQKLNQSPSLKEWFTQQEPTNCSATLCS